MSTPSSRRRRISISWLAASIPWPITGSSVSSVTRSTRSARKSAVVSGGKWSSRPPTTSTCRPTITGPARAASAVTTRGRSAPGTGGTHSTAPVASTITSASAAASPACVTRSPRVTVTPASRTRRAEPVEKASERAAVRIGGDDAQRAAERRRRLDELHPVAADARNAGALHPGRPPADDQHPPRVLGGRISSSSSRPAAGFTAHATVRP